MSLLLGPDVSQWQGTVDWRAVAKNRPFAFTKATDGASFVNPTFAENWNGMRAAGLTLRGAYHFAQPGDPVAQAKHFVDTVNAHGGFPPGTVAVLDAEVPLKANAAGWIDAWCAAVESLSGLPAFRIGIYSSLGWFDAWNIPTVLNRHFLWVADYSTATVKLPPGVKAWAFWQYTQTGHTAGIDHECDLSYFHGSKAQLRALAGVKSGTASTLGKIIGGAILGAAALASANHVVNAPPKPKPPVVHHAPVYVLHGPIVLGQSGPRVVKLEQRLKIRPIDGHYTTADSVHVVAWKRGHHVTHPTSTTVDAATATALGWKYAAK